MSEADRSALFGGAIPAGIQTRDVMRDDFGFEVPLESVPLPSNGVVYPPESSLHMRETVEIRSMTAREEDILTSRALIKKGTVITELIKSCLIDKKIHVPDMLAGDRNAIMVALRITGYGAEYAVEADCPKCNVRSKQEFNLGDMPIKRLQIEPVAKGQNVFEFKLPVTKKTVNFKFLTGRDEEEISTIQERTKKQGAQADNIVTNRLQFAIVSIDGKTDRSSINGFIRNMPARDSMSLRKFIDANEPGIDMKGNFDCPSCSDVNEVRVPLGASFFWPDA
jgi:hypothetical protein